MPGAATERSVVGVIAPAVTAAALAGLGALGELPMAVGVVVLQALAGATWLIVADTPFPIPSVLLVGIAAGVADALVLADYGVDDTTGVVAVGLIVAILLELVRRDRRRVVASIAATMSGIVVTVLGAQLIALRELDDGTRLVLIALLSWTAGALAAAVSEHVLPQALVQIAVASGAGAGLAALADQPTDVGALLGLAAASASLAATMTLALAATGSRGRRRAACRTLAALLPPLVVAPAAYGVALVMTG